MSSNNPNYLQVVNNAFQAKSAWRYASFVLGAISVLLAHALISSVNNQPVVLITHEMASSTGRMTVKTSGEIRGTSDEYTANVAMADLGLILNFTPDNIITQHRRFLNRVTESLYSTSAQKLLADAELLKADNISQSFHPLKVQVSSKGDKVYVSGVQIRYHGTSELQRENLEYVLTYSRYKGFFFVADLSQSRDVERDRKEAQKEAQNAKK